MKGKRGTGERYEHKVCQYLVKKKYHIIEKNFRFKYFEIDIIAIKDKIILFAEVKYRKNKQDFRVYSIISKRQQKNIRQCAEAFLHFNPKYSEYFGRFDIFLVTINGGINDIKIEHFENAF